MVGTGRHKPTDRNCYLLCLYNIYVWEVLMFVFSLLDKKNMNVNIN